MSEMINSGNIKIYVEDSYDEMSRRAADILCKELKQNPNGVYGFATGSTPLGMYKELIARNKNGEIDFSGASTYNLDEYYPISKNNDQSYNYFMKKNLFDSINIKPDNINIPNGEAADPNAECAQYEEKIRKSGGISLQLLGIGHNGHIGFNEPGETFSGITSCVDLTESTINANSRFFASKEEVPKQALSMGVKTIMLARKVLLIASSAEKSEILNKALFGEITPKVPASALQLHRDLTVVIDKEAAKNLKR